LLDLPELSAKFQHPFPPMILEQIVFGTGMSRSGLWQDNFSGAVSGLRLHPMVTRGLTATLGLPGDNQSPPGTVALSRFQVQLPA
jgi:hypothetical protein